MIKVATIGKTKGKELMVKLVADVDGAVLRGALDLDAAQAIKDLLKLAGAEETP